MHKYTQKGWTEYEKNNICGLLFIDSITVPVLLRQKGSEDAAGMQAEKESVKVLVAFFSYGGNTRKLAETAAQYTGGDLFRIETEKSYSEDYDKCLEETAREMEENARPALSSHVENMEAYDVVLLGYPIWWGSMPMAVNTFLEEYDFEGKIIAPFCTHGGSGLGSSEQDLKNCARMQKLLRGWQFMAPAQTKRGGDGRLAGRTGSVWGESGQRRGNTGLGDKII